MAALPVAVGGCTFATSSDGSTRPPATTGTSQTSTSIGDGSGSTAGSARSTTSSGATDPTGTPGSAPPSDPSSPPPPTSAPSARAAVDRLVVAEPDPALPDYRRAAFGDGWDYDPSSGCNTREHVLIAESQVPVTFGTTRCHPVAGRWRSAYDGITTTDPADLEIDHLVPLADVWRSGGAAWTAERREAYANDLADPNTLAAVTSHANRSKSDRTPDQWLPPDRRDWCAYATDWVEVKLRWRLTVAPAEKATLVQLLADC